MQNRRVWASVGLAGWLILTAGVLGQLPNRRPAPVQVPTVLRDARPAFGVPGLTARGLLGATLSVQNNQTAGTIDDLIFADDGFIDCLVVRTGNQFVLVPWEAATFNADQRTALVNITLERFREIPTFIQGNWPNLAEANYRDRLYNYYGLRPGQERRIERRANPRP
jgi:hypothetical protein